LAPLTALQVSVGLKTFCEPSEGDWMLGAPIGQLTVNCLVADTSVQFAKFARTTQLYTPAIRPPAGPVHEFAFAPATEQTRLALAVPFAAKTSYPVTPLVGDGDQLKVIGVLSL
jgi:hypothetical protein